MRVNVYVGAHINALENVAAVAYVILNADTEVLIKTGVVRAKPDTRTIALSSIRAAVKALEYLRTAEEVTIYSDDSRAVSYLTGAKAPKGIHRLVNDIRRRAAILPGCVKYKVICSDRTDPAASLAAASESKYYTPPTPEQYALWRGCGAEK